MVRVQDGLTYKRGHWWVGRVSAGCRQGVGHSSVNRMEEGLGGQGSGVRGQERGTRGAVDILGQETLLVHTSSHVTPAGGDNLRV